MISVYEKLREQLDQYSTGFPATKSGVEIKILKHLFSEDEALLYLDLTLMLETPDAVAERTNRDPQQVSEVLENMAQKGLIFRLRKDGNVRYGAVPFVIGSYEFQVKHMDEALAKLFEAYFQEGMLSNLSHNVSPLRTIPVNQSIDVGHKVSPYEDARQILKTKNKIALAECICRKQQEMIGKGCDKPKEVCLIFGSHAAYYVENKLARYIDQEEALTVLDRCEEAGLVNQPANMVNPGGMCNCCGDCCGVLRGLNLLSKPAEMVFNKYYAEVIDDECTGCETCLDRCQMEAITLNDDDIAVINQDRCIGCGLCVTTCPTEAIKLSVKPEDQQPIPPDGKALFNMTAEKRGKTLIPLSMSND